MLKIILKSGAKLRVGHEFWATNDMPNVIFDLESSEPSTFITLKLTPTETIRLCDALSELVNVIGETCSTGANPINDGVYTSILDLHPRAERLLSDAGVTLPEPPAEIQVAPICNTDPLDNIVAFGDLPSVDHRRGPEYEVPQTDCIVSDDSPIGWRVTEPHGMEWQFVTREEALMWACRIDEENERWGDKPLDLPWFMTMVPVADIDLNQAYHDGKE